MATIEHLHIICYNWGTKYGPTYVDTLRAMVARHLSIPHTFHCITDDPAKLDSRVVVHELPNNGVDGIWRKLMTFQDNFLDLEGQFVVSLDLDVVIVDSLDFLAERPDVDFWIARNWARRKDSARASGSAYRLKVGSNAFIWERFYADVEEAVDSFHGKNRDIGEQNWLDGNIDEFTYFPEGKVCSFKRHCNAKGRHFLGEIGASIGLTTAAFGVAQPPAEAAIVSFHGDPLPPDVAMQRHGRWRRSPFVAEHWV